MIPKPGHAPPRGLKAPSTSPDIAERLAGWPKSGDGIGFHRMLFGFEQLGMTTWLEDLEAIKVTGSNGKGSTVAILGATLQELGLKSGLFTSPHLRHPAERVAIDGAVISEGAFEEAWFSSEKVAEAWAGKNKNAKDEDRFGSFELLTLAALRAFAKNPVDVVVTEAGIGGRLDPTRTIPGRFVGLTSLDLEHRELLGGTLAEIAFDKADLCPDGGVLVTGADVEQELGTRLQAYAQIRGIELIRVGDQARLYSCRAGGPGMLCDMEWRGQRFDNLPMALAGSHQWSNAVVALLLAEAWLKVHRPTVAAGALLAAWRRAVSKVSLPGRFERLAESPEIFVDFCHSPRAAEALASWIREALDDRPILLVLGISAGKEIDAIAEPLLALANAVILTRARHRGGDPRNLESLVCDRFPGLRRWRMGSLEEAMEQAREVADQRSMSILVAGGIFLGVEAKEILAGRSPEQLRFF